MMLANQKVTGTAKPMPIGLLYGWLLEMGITVLYCMLLAMLISAGQIEWTACGYGIMIMLLLSSFLGAWFSCSMIKRQLFLTCVFSGAVYICTLLGMTVLLFNAEPATAGITALLAAGGSMSAAIILNAKFKKPGGRMRIRGHNFSLPAR